MKYHYASTQGTPQIQHFEDIEALPQKFIYASYKPHANQTFEEAIEHLMACKQHWLECFVDDQFMKIAVDDLLHLKPVVDGSTFYIPLCATVRTHIDFNRFPTQTLNAVLRYLEISPKDCTAENHGFFAINSQDNFWSDRSTHIEDWKDFIPVDYIEMCAATENERSKLYKTFSTEKLAWFTKPIY